MLNPILGPSIKRIIREKCLKQSAIAKKAGYTKQQFNSMLNGRKIIKDTDVATIAEALGVDANELFKKEVVDDE